jgi:broad specificity phosphatase PhoE
MKYLKLVFLITILFLTTCKPEEKTIVPIEKPTSIFYLIRHAEKNRSDSLNSNPHLTDKGTLRAEKWSHVFKNISFDAVYSTDYNRTRATALPTAIKNNLELTIYDPKTIKATDFLNNNKGKNILIVGHSNSTPTLVNAILKSETYKDIDDYNFSNLYTVTINGDEITSSLLFID